MNQKDIQNYLMSDVKILSGVGPKVKTLLRKKKLRKFQICYGIFLEIL